MPLYLPKKIMINWEGLFRIYSSISGEEVALNNPG
jgi:hypothetical protein